MKRTITAILFTLVSVVIFAGCSGEGELKIKAIGSDGKVVENLDILIDDKNMGTTQLGFVSYKVEEGEHIIKLVFNNKDAEYTKTYTKKIMLTDKSIVEVIIDTEQVEPLQEFSKSRLNKISELFKKYNLIGTWRLKGAKELISINKNGEWKDTQLPFYYPNNAKVDIKHTSKLSFDPNTYLVDTKKGLAFYMNKDFIEIKYPTISNNCFRFAEIGKNNADAPKYCKVAD